MCARGSRATTGSSRPTTTSSGGPNKFSVEDVTGATVPFTILAGAATNSLFLDGVGRLGLRTATPGLDVHVATGNTPAFRMEQTSGGGLTAQTWDIGANEANFFVRDLTSGSRLPLRVRPGAPTSSLDIAANGNVGIGTASPGTKLHVFGAAGADVIRAAFGPSATPTTADGVNIGYGGLSFGAGSAFINAHSAAGNAAKLLRC